MRLSRFPAQGATVHHGYGITDSFWHLDVILGKPDVGSISRLNGYLQADPNPHESASCRNRQEIVSRATRRPMHSCRRSAIRLPEYITNLIDTQCLAGIFLLGHWTSRSKLEAMLSAVNHVSPQGIKPIVATDHEGGEIQNIRVPGVDHLPSQEALARMSPAKVQAVVTTGARQLAKLGVHMVFSPWLASSTLALGYVISQLPSIIVVSEPIRTSAGNTRQPSLRDTAKRGSFRPLSIFLASDGSRRILTSNPPGLLTTRPPATTDILSLSGWPLTLDLKPS